MEAMKTLKDIVSLIGVILMLCGILYIGFHKPRKVVEYRFETDTLRIRDTVHLPVPVPEKVYIARTDTLFVTITDTVSVPVYIPIERKTYQTEDYEAVIEGYRANLLSLTVYPQVTTIYNREIQTQIKRSRFGLGPAVGFVIGPDGRIVFSAGITFQYHLISF